MLTKLFEAPTVPAVTLDDIKSHLRIDLDDTDHDIRLIPYLQSAIAQAEDTTGRALIIQVWDLVFRSWAELGTTILPFGELRSVTHVKYKDTDGAEQTVSTDNYLVDSIGADEGRILFGGNFNRPGLWKADPITVRIVCGYGDTATAVPSPIQSAIKLLVSDQENGDDSKSTIHSLLYPYRLFQL